MSWTGSVDWTRLQDQLQQDAAFRTHDRIEPGGPLDGEELFNPESDPWAVPYEPWPAPSSVSIPDATGYSLWSETELGRVTDQIFGDK